MKSPSLPVSFVLVSWVFLGTLGLLLGRFLAVGGAPPLVKDAAAAEPEKPKCLKERRMHAWGTYRARYGASGSFSDEPIDLQISECLAWDGQKPFP